MEIQDWTIVVITQQSGTGEQGMVNGDDVPAGTCVKQGELFNKSYGKEA